MFIKYEIWNHIKIQEYINLQEYKKHFDGFDYFGSNTIIDIEKYNQFEYRNENLSELEIQKEFNKNPIYYSRFIVALKKEKIIGILVCQWIKDELPFWRYHAKWVDVHQKFRNKKIAKKLIQLFSKSEFLKFHILQTSIFSEMGNKFLKNKNYSSLNDIAIIGPYYAMTIPPKETGYFDEYGRRIN